MIPQELLELLGLGTIKIDLQTDTEEEEEVEEVVVEDDNSQENQMSEEPENDRDPQVVTGDNKSDYSDAAEAGAEIESNPPSNSSTPSHCGGITDSESGEDFDMEEDEERGGGQGGGQCSAVVVFISSL